MKKLKIYSVIAAMMIGAAFTAKAQDTSSFKPSGKLWGQVFGDYQWKQHSDSAGRGSTQYAVGKGYPQNFNSFDFRRIYLGYDYNFTEKFTAQLLISHEGNNFDAQGNRSFLPKLANVRWKEIYKGADLVIGQQSTNAYVFLEEQIWGYRSIEKTILDMRGLTKSSDFGIALQGKCKDGTYGYNVLYANNSPITYGPDPAYHPYKKVYADIFGKFLDKKLVVQLYGDYEKIQNDSVNFPQQPTKITMKGFVAYQSDPITIGVAVFQQTASKSAIRYLNSDTTKTKDTTDATPFGISIFAHAPIVKNKLAVFVRWDSYDPDSKYSNNYSYVKGPNTTTPGVNGHVKESFLTAGLDWTPTSNVHLMPNVWWNGYSDNATGTTGKVKSDYDMDIRLTFFWKF